MPLLLDPVTQARPSEALERHVVLQDGTKLFYRAWLPAVPTTKALLLFHRGHEHSGRWQETVEALGLTDVAIFAWDQRGHGHSPGERGSAPNLATVVHDADEWFRHLVAEYGIVPEDTIALAHSLGAVVATAWVHDYAPRLHGLILATPAFEVNLFVPGAIPALRLKEKLLGPGYVKSYVSAGMLTHDREQARRYQEDPMIFRQIAINMLLDLRDTAKRLVADAAAITTPLLVLSAGADWVVKEKPQRHFVERAGSTVKRFERLPGFSHAIFHEKDRHVVVKKIRAFLDDRYSAKPHFPSHAHAHEQGYTFEEHARLAKPGGYHFAPVRWMVRGPGRLSQGIALGCQHGFDSGQMLDYIYENKPRGYTFLGRMIDRAFLHAIGWRGIRARRDILQRLLHRAIDKMQSEGRDLRLLDIAAGAGRYVLETMAALQHLPISAVLRDYRVENVRAAEALRDQLGLQRVSIGEGDAFDHDALAASTPRPTIALVSGLYELFSSNELVMQSLMGLSDAVPAGGCLLYTNQPWHPQLEFIARALRNHVGQPWVMRRRTQAEMDELVRLAGFEKVEQETDPWGLFSVSLARRVA
jgi:alpha-beta hydrolase superfamily lysophospholipase